MRKRLPGTGPDADCTANAVPRPAASRRGWWSIGGLIAIAAALAVAAAGLAWRDDIQLSTARPDPDLVTSAVLLVLVAGFVASIVLAVASAPTGQQRPRQRAPWWQVPFRLALLAAMLYALFHLDLPRLGSPDPPDPRPSEAPDNGAADLAGAERAWTQPVSIAALIVLVLCVLALLTYARREAPTPPAEPPPLPSAEETARTLAQAAAAGRRALDTVDDERAAVIACYEAMQATLGRRGVAGKGADTATDLLDRAVRLGVVRGPSAYRLVELFGQARFAHDRLPPGASDQARSALRALEAETAPAATR